MFDKFPNLPWFEAWTSLAALAACINRIRIGYPPGEPLSSMEAFCDFVGRYHEIGFNKFLFDYWTELDSRFDTISHISREKLLERFARKQFPP